MVVLLAVLAGAGWLLLPRLGVGAHTGSSATADSTPAPVAKEAVVPDHKKQQKNSKVRVPAAAVSPAVEVPGTNTEASAPAPASAPPPVPAPKYLPPSELKQGLNRTEVNRLFGGPDIRATTLNRGSMFETYVYVQKPEGQTVVAVLRDGKVEQVKSAPQ